MDKSLIRLTSLGIMTSFGLLFGLYFMIYSFKNESTLGFLISFGLIIIGIFSGVFLFSEK
jgi:hypothetical protein